MNLEKERCLWGLAHELWIGLVFTSTDARGFLLLALPWACCENSWILVFHICFWANQVCESKSLVSFVFDIILNPLNSFSILSNLHQTVILNLINVHPSNLPFFPRLWSKSFCLWWGGSFLAYKNEERCLLCWLAEVFAPPLSSRCQ